MTRIIALVFASVALGWSGLLGYWMQDRALPVDSHFVEVVGPVHRNGRLLIRWDVFRLRACQATRGDIVLDAGGVRWVLAEQHFPDPPGPMGKDGYVSQTPLPEGIPVGRARLHVSLSYVCNPTQYLFPIRDPSIPEIPFDILP